MEIYFDRQPVTLGDDVAQLDIVLHGGTYITSQIQICMFAEGSVPRFTYQFWPYPKTWKM